MALMLMLLLPFGASAQISEGGLFNTDFYNDQTERQGLLQNRDVVISWSLTNQSFGQDAPLGSGLAILLAAGAGYAIVRRKRARKNTLLLLACVALLGFTQCKKDEPQEPESVAKTIKITLNASANNGSRHTINTGTGAVTYQEHDLIYVGNGGKYIGTLECNNSGVFEGEINEPANNSEIYFYFIGGLATTPAELTKGTTASFTVDISDQSSTMPVLSCNHVTYHTGTSSYSCVLLNQCALVKFTTSSTTAPVHVGGLYTSATINFATNSITNNGTTGFVALKSESATEKWAVLLPQTVFSGAEGVIADKGYTVTMPTIVANAYLTGGDAISISSTPSHKRYLQWATSDLTYGDALVNNDIVTGTLAGNYEVSIADGATVTLNNVNINGSGSLSKACAGITCEGDATVILSGTNIVRGLANDYPGIKAPFKDPESDAKTLTIQGTGSLTATSNGRGAGIGSDNCGVCGNISITGGTVTAISNGRGAGIGSGNGGVCGDISISNDVTNVTAIKSNNSAYSIGSGDGGSCGTVRFGGVTINLYDVSAGNYGGLTLAISTTTNTNDTWTLTPAPAPSVPSGAIDGLFSVSSTKQVYFSQGNLQAVGTTSSSPSSGWTWQFAEHQWDYIGGRSQGGSEPQTGNNYINGNGTLSANGTVDLFCWSTNATYYGIHNSEYNSSYSGDFYDWGNTIGSGWRTLTNAEWEWIMGPSGSPTPGTNCRTSSTVNGVENARYAKATVADKTGLIIFPDSYTHPGDVTAPASVNTAGAAYTVNSYDATAWGKMEAAGAVFLPATGSRNTATDNSVQGCGVIGGYWSSVVQSDDNAYCLAFQPSDIGPSAFNPKRFGASVRLVKDAN